MAAPVFVAGQPVTAAQLNALSAGLVTINGTTGISAMPSGAAPIIQAGSAVLAAASATVTFPTAFPNGIVAVLICNGDATASANPAMGVAQSSTSGFVAKLSGSTVPWRCNWIAIGW